MKTGNLYFHVLSCSRVLLKTCAFDKDNSCHKLIDGFAIFNGSEIAGVWE